MRITCYVSRVTAARIQAAAKADNRSVTSLIRDIIERELPRAADRAERRKLAESMLLKELES